jgi:hypothetical protein
VTEDERGSLWRTDVQFPDWAWTLTAEQYVSAGDLQEELTRLAKLDGFDLEFIMLIGPDNFAAYSKLKRDRCYCDKMLISTAARAPKNYSSLSGPPKLSNCTIWTPVTPHREKTKPQGQSPSWLYPDDTPPQPTPQASVTQIWECHAHDDPDLTARYLYTPPALSDISATELVSATAIHAAINTTTKSESSAYIDEFALGPVFLKQQLARRGDGSHQLRQNLLAAEVKLKHLAFEDIKAGKMKNCNCGDECTWQCNHTKRQTAKRQAAAQTKQQQAAESSFPFCLESAQPGNRYTPPKEKLKPQTAETQDEDSEDEQKVEDDEMAFEDTMRLRVRTKKEKIPVHKPEYANANVWLSA